MISVQQAKLLIKENCAPLGPVSLSIENCAGLTLHEDVYTKGDFPAFAQSSMDGYAFVFEDFLQSSSLTISGELAAGATDVSALPKNSAIRIFTGAPLPPNADTVVMQEKTRVENGYVTIEDKKLVKGSNTRAKGSDISGGALAAAAGVTLSPALVGFLAGIGYASLRVIPKPRISVIVTGKELLQPGKELAFGQVYESNSYALRSVLSQLHLNTVEVIWADDEPEMLNRTLEKALLNSDLILLAGGISVGDYDFVLQATQVNQVRQIFHKVKQKPGKPLFFGMKNQIPVFGLPGNPSSVLTCFYEYVIPAIERLMQRPTLLRTHTVELATDISNPQGLTQFLKARFDGKVVTPLSGQESYRMNSYAQANCLLLFPEEKELLKAGDLVEIHHTDYFSFI